MHKGSNGRVPVSKINRYLAERDEMAQKVVLADQAALAEDHRKKLAELAHRQSIENQTLTLTPTPGLIGLIELTEGRGAGNEITSLYCEEVVLHQSGALLLLRGAFVQGAIEHSTLGMVTGRLDQPVRLLAAGQWKTMRHAELHGWMTISEALFPEFVEFLQERKLKPDDDAIEAFHEHRASAQSTTSAEPTSTEAG